MEVRCRKCNKLFRVSDDKITGRGVKFACTRCGDSVKITREEFENYSLSKLQPAVTATGLFQTKAEPAIEPAPGPEPAVGGGEAGSAAVMEAKAEAPSSQTVPDFLREREESSPLPNPFEESPAVMEQTPVEEQAFPSEPAREEIQTEPVREPEILIESEPQGEPVPPREPIQEPAPNAELKPEPAPPVLASDAVPEPATEQGPAVKLEAPAAPKVGAGPAVMAKQKKSSAVAAVPPREPVPAADAMAMKPAKETVPSEPPRSGRLFIAILAVLIIGLAGFGAYLYMRPTSPSVKGPAPAPAMVSIEGLQIVNPAGSLDANGDLLVSGVLENLTDKERADWYLVVEVFDAQGKVLNTIRMLNGKQIYTKRDYAVLAARGVNVQELKEKALQPRGVVLPPKGQATFEVRYLQPPAGIASFNAALQPFDPVRLLKEIEAETR